MRLPNAENAVIAPEKLRDYLLREEHPDNQHKARLFEQLGYTPANWQVLAADLRRQHLTQDGVPDRSTADGVSWRIVAELSGPSGTATIKSVWIFDSGSDTPRFVTAYQGHL